MARPLPFLISETFHVEKPATKQEPWEGGSNPGMRLVQGMRDRMSFGNYAALPKPLWQQALDMVRG